MRITSKPRRPTYHVPEATRWEQCCGALCLVIIVAGLLVIGGAA